MADTRRRGPTAAASTRVEIARIERLLRETPAADLARLFSAQELADSGDGPGRAASLAARFAAKEACVKLFPREAALGADRARRFLGRARQLRRAAGRAAAPNAQAVLDRHRIAVDSAVADPRPHERLGRGARRAGADRGRRAAGRLHLALPAAAPRGRAGEPAARVRRHDVRKPRSSASRAAHYGHLWRLARRVPALPLAVAGAEAGAGARREHRGLRRRARRRARAS